VRWDDIGFSDFRAICFVIEVVASIRPEIRLTS
jgi:hypothetical protein